MMQYTMKRIPKNKSCFRWMILFIVMILGGHANAQRCLSEEMKAEKVAYFTNFLDLSSKESAAFWPIYNDYESNRRDIHSKLRAYYGEIHEVVKTDDNQKITELSLKISDAVVEEGGLLKKYQPKFEEAIGPKKALRLFLAERSYRVYLMKRYRKGGGNRHGRK
ncbi:hypothetical protein K4L44_03670 [Halosquirtibacter laminarini]|uniref:Uncharacterized protein n=1 Tax=Halosquirtibacter laminarini TaxID=3374600 RepID=A0AC61NR70_9BACT|nr:hypothetical protein K4L44_03670 [Prolixibacteraceae bacterium]